MEINKSWKDCYGRPPAFILFLIQKRRELCEQAIKSLEDALQDRDNELRVRIMGDYKGEKVMSAKELIDNFEVLNAIEKVGSSPGFRKLWIDIFAGDTWRERYESKREVQKLLILKAIKRHCSRERAIRVISEFFVVPYSTIDCLWRQIEGVITCKQPGAKTPREQKTK
jgi:hypothetical protein